MLPDCCDLTLFINSYDKVDAVKEVDGQPFKVGAQILESRSARSTPRQRRRPCSTATSSPSTPTSATAASPSASARYDRSHKLMRNRKVRVFKKQTVGDAVKKILQENGFRAGKFDRTGPQQEWFQQDNETDWEFIWRLARSLDFWVLIEGGTVDFVEAGKPSTRPRSRSCGRRRSPPSTRG